MSTEKIARNNFPSTSIVQFLGLKKFSFLRMDLNEKAEQIGRLAREQNLAWVANFAAQSMVAESWLTPVHWYQTMPHISLTGLKHLQMRVPP